MSRTGGRHVWRKPGRKAQLRALGFGHQGRCLQGGDAKPQGADILPQKTGAHFFFIRLQREKRCGRKKAPEKLPKN